MLTAAATGNRWYWRTVTEAEESDVAAGGTQVKVRGLAAGLNPENL